MTEKVKITGEFRDINFQTKVRKDDGRDQAALLTFRMPMQGNAQSDALNLVLWQRQEVHLEVSKRQPSLPGTEDARKDQPPLPLAAPGAESQELGSTWQERIVDGPDGLSRGIFVRADRQAFNCWDCRGFFQMDPVDCLETEIARHVCDGGEGADFRELRAVLRVKGDDGVTRVFSYDAKMQDEEDEDVFFEEDEESPLRCRDCHEEVPVDQKADYWDELFPLRAMRRHVCPPICHKCRMEARYGVSLADRIRFHHPECPLAKLLDREVATAYVPGEDPYEGLVREAPEVAAADLVLEDATECFARIQEECGLPRTVGRTGRDEYAGIDSLPKKDRAPLLKEMKKASKDAWSRAQALLADCDAGKKLLKAREDQEREDRWNRQKEEQVRAERERMEKALSGPDQEYDLMLREALCQKQGVKPWVKLQKDGADDWMIDRSIRNAIGNSGSLNVPGQTSLVWKDSYRPRVWFGPATGAPTLEGRSLTDAVRRIFKIPPPTPEADDAEEKEPSCRACGCTENYGCDLPRGCFWVEEDLCSNPRCLRQEGYDEEKIQALYAEVNVPVPIVPEASGEQAETP